MKLYLVGGYLREDGTKKDIDICGVLSERDFDLMFGFSHASLQEAYKERIRSEKLKKYLQANRVAGNLLSHMFGKKVDFKWIPPSMLYNPHIELHLEADVTMYL